MIKVEDLQQAFQLMELKNVDYVYPVTEYPHPVQRAMRIMGNKSMKFVNPEMEMVRTQDLETLYHDAGQFYLGKTAAWLMNNKMHTDGIGMPIPHWRVVDIDTLDDWKRAENLFYTINNNLN